MAELTVWDGGKAQIFSVEIGITAAEALRSVGLYRSQPCGGHGLCGKCRIILSGEVSAPTASERAAGFRLACQTVLLGDAQIVLDAERPLEQIELAEHYRPIQLSPMEGHFGAAIDIGTTTIVLQLYDLRSGRLLAQSASENPQRSIAADVMGRIGAAMRGSGEVLREQVFFTLRRLLAQSCKSAGCSPSDVASAVITGNTTMLYLLTSRDPECLSHAPFCADTLFDTETEILERHCYLPPCMDAFVGADITCAVLHSEMCMTEQTTLLCDIGTNGELALWKNGTLYVTSTAAGPAFEGAGISCGCGSVVGAIDRVWLENGALRVHTIHDAPPVGVCGSGLLDAVAALLALGEIDETGATDADKLKITESIALLPTDIRNVQLAKAAIAAGIATILEAAEVTPEEVGRVYIAGGFGNHLNIASATTIGLLPSLWRDRVTPIGNAALSGAARLLLERSQWEAARDLAARAVHLNLGGDSVFLQYYMENILFPDA